MNICLENLLKKKDGTILEGKVNKVERKLNIKSANFRPSLLK